MEADSPVSRPSRPVRGHLGAGDVVALVCRLAGSAVAPEIRGAGNPDGEIDRQWVDFSKLHELTGWEPRVGLEEGLTRTIEWFRAHPGAAAA